MFQGLRTLIYRVKESDLSAAKEYYSKLLEMKPYFDEPFYVGFSVEGFELGLDPTAEKIILGDTVQTYLGVPDIKTAFVHALKCGASAVSEIRNVGGDINLAVVRDPFGNIFGLIENPSFKIHN